ncbi:MerR family transcriptional regulator [Aeromonas allosaccharophila]|uniref:MerR family transcriptional regulator n=1 Tax=Aeromonas allosaccharophila TaxID=656 RepID=UPI001F37B306|nr:MerR family transcriptional regulator [Aeromonas allosaccharophila]MCE9848961.1 MerR family transcriptional regulator [Aeromonas allosaccharophila]
MLTITRLARELGLSRTTLLYYERLGLLLPALRGENGYRRYGEAELERGRQIASFRTMGLPLEEIGTLLTARLESHSCLDGHLLRLDQEIAELRRQQRAIILYRQQTLEEIPMVDKARWVAIMQAAGMTEEMMRNWHIQFEKMEPQAHQEFLESLQIPAAEIAAIRTWSRGE